MVRGGGIPSPRYDDGGIHPRRIPGLSSCLLGDSLTLFTFDTTIKHEASVSLECYVLCSTHSFAVYTQLPTYLDTHTMVPIHLTPATSSTRAYDKT